MRHCSVYFHRSMDAELRHPLPDVPIGFRQRVPNATELRRGADRNPEHARFSAGTLQGARTIRSSVGHAGCTNGRLGLVEFHERPARFRESGVLQLPDASALAGHFQQVIHPIMQVFRNPHIQRTGGGLVISGRLSLLVARHGSHARRISTAMSCGPARAPIR